MARDRGIREPLPKGADEETDSGGPMKLRTLTGVAFAFALAAPAGLALTSSSANAVTVYQKCGLLKGSATITPGLTTVPQNVTITAHGTLSGCAPTTLTGGSGTITATIHQ